MLGLKCMHVSKVKETTSRLTVDSSFAPSEWERSLQINAASHWPGAKLESAPRLQSTGNTSSNEFQWFESLTSRSSNPLRWRHNGGDSVSNHQPHECLLNRLIRCRSKKTSKLRVAGLCVGNSPGTGEFPAQMARNAENVSILWRHHAELQWFRVSGHWSKMVTRLMRTYTSPCKHGELDSGPVRSLFVNNTKYLYWNRPPVLYCPYPHSKEQGLYWHL